MSKIVDIETEHSSEIKVLFEVLKESLNEAKVDIIRDSNNSESKKNKKSHSSNSESDSDNSATETKPKKGAKPVAKGKGKSKKDESSESEEESDSDDDSNSKKKKKPQKKKTVTKPAKGKGKSKKVESSESEESDSEEEKTGNKKESEIDKSNGGGIRILALDEHQTLLIYVKLNSDQFVNFYVKPAIHSIGLDLIQFHKFMKTVDKDSIMRIYIDKDDEQNIVFELQNNVKNNNSSYRQKLLDIDDNAKKLPQGTSFEMSVMMDTTDFRKICTEMAQFSEYVEITCTSKEITFKCQGDSNAYVKTFKNSDTGVRIVSPKNNGKAPNIVQAIYNLKHLVTFGNCVNLCTEMQLYLKNDYPLFIHYSIGLLGKMLVGLSPVDEKAIKRDNDYDENMDKYYNGKKVAMKDI